MDSPCPQPLSHFSNPDFLGQWRSKISLGVRGNQMSDRKQKEKEKKAAVLSRYPGQRILIGDSITVRVAKVEGKRVFVYVEATEDYEIVRPSKEEDAADRAKAGESPFG